MLKALSSSQTLIYGIVSFLLIVGAFVLIGGSAYHFVIELRDSGIEHGVLRALEDLLLVIMLAEILHTVAFTLKSKKLACEPFLVVGVIAAVRRMLIITAELGSPTDANKEIFQLVMLELGLLTFSIAALCIGIYFLRKQREDINEPEAV